MPKRKWLFIRRFFLFATLVTLFGIKPPPAEAFFTNPFPNQSYFSLSPFWDWKTIETPNFRVTFPEELTFAAQKTANLLEEAHATLSPLFQWQPSTKTLVLLVDNADSANGITAAFARAGLLLYITPPDPWMSTSYYDDWLRFLVFHEYTHLLNLDTTEGIWSSLRSVFGATFLPNQTWPRWMLEGLAVYIETRFTKGGRGRSPYFEMMLRAAVEEGVLNDAQFITLDKLIGTNPYFPGGETPYQFGYHLMNQVAKRHGTETLGQLSKNAGGGVPFFINTQLKNLTGQDWIAYWDEWLHETRIRAKQELEKIHSHPTTKFVRLTEKKHDISNDALGAAVSRDGRWLAYNLVSADRRPGLYLREIATGKTRHLDDKLQGVGLAFTPDSQGLLFSAIRRNGGQFTFLSDLGVYDFEKDTTYWLSDKLRAKDPDLSPDGKSVTFTLTESSVTGLAIAPLEKVDGHYQLGPVQKLYMPPRFDRVGNPHFSPDGRKIYFSFHKNGVSQEDLMVLDLSQKAHPVSVVYSDGYYNRYPTVNSKGELFFVSNATGVDNIYRLDSTPTLITNMTTGIAYPAFAPHSEKFYASVFSSSGWDIAEIEPLHRTPVKDVTIDPVPVPPVPEKTPESQVTYSIQNYSIFPSILPRVWTPLLNLDSRGITAGAQVWGVDSVDRNRYSLGAVYNSGLQTIDAYGLYSNRSFGPVTNFSVRSESSFVNGLSYTSIFRNVEIGINSAHPFTWTWSTFTPTVGLNLQRLYAYDSTTNNYPSDPTRQTPWIPQVDAAFSFQNIETSTLAIAPEGGRSTQLGARLYLQDVQPSWKLFVKDQEFIRLAKHTVLIPSIKASWASIPNAEFGVANVFTVGRNPQKILDSFYGDGFSQLFVRGYPGMYLASRLSTVGALDFRFPIGRIFRGWSTRPFFLENLYGIAFVEGGYTDTVISQAFHSLFFSSAGTGLRLRADAFLLPFEISAEYHQGFQKEFGGAPDLFIQIVFLGMPF